jgi:hypothetical protein
MFMQYNHFSQTMCQAKVKNIHYLHHLIWNEIPIADRLAKNADFKIIQGTDEVNHKIFGNSIASR